MITTEYKIAYAEILEILKHITKEERDKIPRNMIEMFKANACENESFVYDPIKNLEDNNVSETTKSIIAILYRDYWTTKEQKQKILDFQNREREKCKAEKYDVNDIFENRKESILDNNYKSITTEESLVIVKKQNFMQKILKKLKKRKN